MRLDAYGKPKVAREEQSSVRERADKRKSKYLEGKLDEQRIQNKVDEQSPRTIY